MDPLSIVGTCFTLSKTIYANIKRCSEVGETLNALTRDQRELHAAIECFQAQIPPEATPQWHTLGTSLTGLATTMNTMEDVLNEIRRVELGAATRPVQMVRLQLHNEQITALRQKIETHVRTIQLSVQFISLYKPPPCGF